MANYSPTAGNDGSRIAAAWVNSLTSATLTPGLHSGGILFTGLSYPVNYPSLSLRLYCTAAAAGTLHLYVIARPFLRPESTVPVFGPGRVPGLIAETGDPSAQLRGSYTVPAGTHAPLILNVAEALVPYLRHSEFTGSIPLTLQWGAEAAGSLTILWSETPGSAPALDTGTELPSLTGLDGLQYVNGWSRVSECPRTGFRGLRENWVRDGWNNMLVDPRGYNPADYTEQYVHYERPPVNDEG